MIHNQSSTVKSNKRKSQKTYMGHLLHELVLAFADCNEDVKIIGAQKFN
jgi:hypothetical protein